MDEHENDERLNALHSKEISHEEKQLSKNTPVDKILSFFRQPLVGILGSIASFISIPLAFYFYLASIREPLLTYYVHPVRVPVVQTGKMSDVKVLFKDAPIQGDLTVAQIEIWNSGKAPIKTDEILTPILIQTENSVPILEVSLLKVSRPLTEISLDESRLTSGIVGVHWRILEQYDACVLQILYSGPGSVRISVAGDIEGQKRIQEVTYPGTIRTPEEQYSPPNRWIKILTNFGLWLLQVAGMAALILGLSTILFRGKRPSRFVAVAFTIILSIILVLFVILTWNRLFISRPEPPIGF